MLSAVENLVPGRVYSHPFSGPSAPSLLSQLPIPPGLPLLNTNYTDMSVAEFARPHPKQRYPDTLRNGLLTSARPKYSDQQQNGPVNLAVSTSSASQSLHGVKSNHLLSDSFHGSSLQQQKDSVELSKFYSHNSRLSFFSSPALEANTYQALNYSLYPFGSAGLYSSSHYPRSTYIPPTQRDAFNASTYLPPVSYGSQPVTTTSGSSNLASNKSKISPLSSSLHSHMNGQLSGHNGIVGPTPVSQDKHEVPIKSIHNSFFDRPYQNGGTTLNGMTLEQQQLLAVAYSNFSKEKENKEKLQQAQSHIEHNNNNSIIANNNHNHNHNNSNNNNTSNSNANVNVNGNDKGFKIPSGKEGSLKHRILTRPYGTDRDGRRKSPTVKTTTTVFKSTENGTTTTNFTKGSLIELANGECRRVEDVRTEDFVQLAEKSSELQLTESTTVKITPKHNQLVVIAVSFDNNKSKVDIETSIEYPFFVYGQGWASCSPEKTFQLFGLKCQQLRVGDICLLLRPRETARKASQPPPQQHQPPPPLQTPQQPLPPPPSFQQMYDQSVPQNLSRRSSHSIFTTASSTRPSLPSLPPPAPIFSIPYSKDHMHHPHTHLHPHPHQHQHHHHHQHQQQHRQLSGPQSSTGGGSMNDNDQPVAMVVNKSSTSTSSSSSLCNDDSLDSSISRKRRWSAPADQDL